jgi:hypothetical protein
MEKALPIATKAILLQSPKMSHGKELDFFQLAPNSFLQTRKKM